MSVQSQINRLNTAVSDQSSLIAQIGEALAGKVINAGGGSGSAVETVTGTITTSEAPIPDYPTIWFTDGTMRVVDNTISSDQSIEVTKGTILVVYCEDIILPTGGVEQIDPDVEWNGVKYYHVIGDFELSVSVPMG